MNKQEYWEYSLSEALEAVGVKLTDEQLTAVAADLCISAEQTSMCFGSDHPQGQRNTELEELKKRYEKQIKELEDRDWIFRKSVAERRGVTPHDVYIEGTSVMYRNSGCGRTSS